MGADEKRRLRDEVAALAEAVHELREQLASHHCHGCICLHYHWQPVPWVPYVPYVSQPYRITCGASTAIPGTVTTTNALAIAS